MHLASRRHLFRYLAASPLLARTAWADTDPRVWAPREAEKLITDPAQALDVFDFEPVAQANVPPAHFGYMATGIDDEMTVRANREAFTRLQLRPRRLVDVSHADMSVELLGTRYASPIFIAPTSSNKALHPDGELAVSRAARAGNHAQCLSTVANTSIEEAIAARGGPVWFQLYMTSNRDIGIALAKRAERAGAPVIAVTVDGVSPQNWETAARMRRADTRICSDCHQPNPASYVSRRPNFDGTNAAALPVFGPSAPSMTWESIARLRDTVKTKLLLKGIQAHEDASRAAELGLDGIIVSNHGGRNEDSNRGTIDMLPEIITAVNGRMPVLIDSGFRRGTDIVKALALGAAAVGIGRPYLWGLGAFGQPGVEKVLELLRRETIAAMRQMGAPTVKDLRPEMVRRA